MSDKAAVLTERSDVTPQATRCRVSTCWHRALPDSDLCAGCYAESMEHTRDGCPDGCCEACDDGQGCPL
jgi:hypothetical protein